MQRAVATILVAVLVVLAGCNGAFSGGNNKSVNTTTPTSDTTPKLTPTPVSQLAPGLTGEGIENASVLIAAHTSFLQNRSFTWVRNRTELAPNGSVVFKSTGTFHESADEKVFGTRKVVNGHEYRPNHTQEVHGELWSNGERLLLKLTYADESVRYIQRNLGNKRGILQWDIQKIQLFGAPNTKIVKQFTKNGMKLYRVQGTKTISGDTNVSLQLVVDGRGVIHEYQIKRNPSTSTLSTDIHELHFSNIGATKVPKRPSWIDKAINKTTPVPEGTPTSTMLDIQNSSTTSA